MAGRDLAQPATIGQAADAMSAHVEGDRNAVFTRVSTDSRTAAAGDLFFCLRGPTFDGHDFARTVAEAGAAGVVCERAKLAEVVAAVAGTATAVLEVTDTLQALGDLAAWTRAGFDGPLVAVTGSNGKTTTKEMMRAIFLAHFGDGRVLATQGNLNNLIGVPLTLFGLAAEHEAAIVEMGMNVPGEIARLTEIAAPTVGVITCVAEAHLEGLGSLEGVAHAKGELFEGLPKNAVAIVNGDDAHVVRESRRFPFPGRHLVFGRAGEVSARDVHCDRIDASTFTIEFAGQSQKVELPLGGRHNVQNALGATAAALAAGIPLETAARGLSKMKPPPMRMAAEKLASGVTLINDAYNANPGSLAAALATLGGLDARRIVVVGDMLELGPRSAELHHRVGEQAAAIDPVLLCAYGSFSGDVAEGARKAGLDAARIEVCARHEDAAAAVARVWLPGDAVLVKGSRGSAMEKVVDALRVLPPAPPSDAAASAPRSGGGSK